MAARCSGCRQPIVDKQPFVIVDVEVFHRVCITLVPQSVVTELRQRVIDRSAEVAQLRTAIDDAKREANQARSDRDNYRRNLERAHERIENLRQIRDQFVERSTAFEQRVESLQNECARLGREVEKMVAAAQPKPAEKIDSKRESDLDDSEQRFRLIELDPKK